MTTAAQYKIGSTVECVDRVCGELKRVIVDPVARTLTHLVVVPRHEEGLTRLVPIALVTESGDPIRLACTGAEYDALGDADDRWFLTYSAADLGYQPEQLLAWPHYRIALDAAAPPEPYTGVPIGTVEIRRGEPVHATDGDLGRVQGLLVDEADNQVTHILLHEGHLWAKRRTAIPIGAVAGVDERGISLVLSADEVRNLPPIDVDADPDRDPDVGPDLDD